MPNRFQVGIIGLGKFGYRFGRTLIQLDQDVIGVDTDPENIKRAQQIFTQVYQADAMDKKVLEQLGFKEMTHVLVSVGDSIAASAMISMYLKELGVPSVWVKGINNDHEKLLRRIGVDEVIIPEHIAAVQLANRLAKPGFIDYLPFEKGVAIKELIVKQFAGKTLREINLTNQFQVQVIATKKNGSLNFKFIPKADDVLEKEDILVVIGHSKRLEQIKP
ncbi:MAG: TrkA family potassium uptake protein [Desulfobacterales bacterium]|nr:TrkA family potassium uptake protein [Desulfobacterales bacterium]